MSDCVKQTNLRRPQSEKKQGAPSSDVPPPPSRSARYVSTRGGSSSVTGKFSTGFEATANDGIIELEHLLASGMPIIVTDSGSSAQYTNPTASKIPASIVSSQPIVSSQHKQLPPAIRRLNNSQRAAIVAHEQSFNTPSAEVFLNLFKTMRSSLATDFDKYHLLISDLQQDNAAQLRKAEQQNIRLQERLVTLEKARGEERGYWEAEKKDLLERLENGEDGRDREERLRREEEEREKEKEDDEKRMRKFIESFEAKKKSWAKEREEREKVNRGLASKVAELEVKKQRLEDTIMNNAMSLERLEALEKEKNELVERFDEEKKKWKEARVSLQDELSFAKHTVKRLMKKRGTAHWGIKKALTDVQRENEIPKETIQELSHRMEWQEEIWHREKSRIEARFKEEINDVTVLRHELYQKETKRKREDGHQEMFLQNVKKPRIETLVDPGQESDEADDDDDDDDDDEVSSVEAPYYQQEYDDMEGQDDGFEDIVEDQGEESSEAESDEQESVRSLEGSEDELQ